MSKLWKLKKWLTVPEAVKNLSVLLGEEISEADIYRFALDGHLALSIDLVNGARVIPGTYIKQWAEKQSPYAAGIADGTGAAEDCEGIDFYEPSIVITGTADVILFGDAMLPVRKKYQQLTGGAPLTLKPVTGVYLRIGKVIGTMMRHEDGMSLIPYVGEDICLLQKRISDMNEEEAKEHVASIEKPWSIDASTSYDDPLYFSPTKILPDNTDFVVRTQALIDFLDAIGAGNGHNAETGVAKRKAPDSFVAALLCLLVEISKRASIKSYDFNPREMPGTKADLQELANRFDADLYCAPRTFDDYLAGLCQFRKGARSGDFYRTLFPEIFDKP